MVIFVYVGVELVGVLAVEILNLKKNILFVINKIFLCILFFYVGVLIIFLCINFWMQLNVVESFFVKIFSLVGILLVVGIINFVVLMLVVFVCNSGMFLISWILYNLSKMK